MGLISFIKCLVGLDDDSDALEPVTPKPVNLSFQLICSDNLLEYVFLWSSSFPSYLFRLVSRFTPDWDVKPKSLCNLYLLSDERCYLSGMPLPFDTSYVSHLVKHVQRRGEHAVKVCCLPDVSDI